MSEKHSAWMVLGLVILGVICILGLGTINYRLASRAVVSEDFVVNWVAARTLIINGDSPYKPEVSRTILTILDAGGLSAEGRSPQFTYPIYTLLLLVPFAFMSELSLAQSIWMTLQSVVLVLFIVLSLYLGRAKPGGASFFVLIVTSFLGYHCLAPIITGSMILVTALFLLLALLALRSGREEICGILLGLTTIQIPFVLLPTVLILLWAIRQKKTLVVLWFFGSVILLSVLGIFLVQDWPGQYLNILFNFTLFFPASSPGAAFRVWWPGIGGLLTWGLTTLTAIVLLIEWRLALNADNRRLLWTIGLTLVLSNWIGLPAVPENLALLTLPLVLCVSSWSQRWGRSGNFVAILCMIIIFVWEWGLVLGNLGQARRVDRLDLLLPMPTLCLIGLYWVRWLFIRPKRLLGEEIRSIESA